MCAHRRSPSQPSRRRASSRRQSAGRRACPGRRSSPLWTRSAAWRHARCSRWHLVAYFARYATTARSVTSPSPRSRSGRTSSCSPQPIRQPAGRRSCPSVVKVVAAARWTASTRSPRTTPTGAASSSATWSMRLSRTAQRPHLHHGRSRPPAGGCSGWGEQLRRPPLKLRGMGDVTGPGTVAYLAKYATKSTSGWACLQAADCIHSGLLRRARTARAGRLVGCLLDAGRRGTAGTGCGGGRGGWFGGHFSSRSRRYSTTLRGALRAARRGLASARAGRNPRTSTDGDHPRRRPLGLAHRSGRAARSQRGAAGPAGAAAGTRDELSIRDGGD